MVAPVVVSPDDLTLPCFYRWEQQRAAQLFLTQPVGGGAVQDISWGEAGHQGPALDRSGSPQRTTPILANA